MKKPDKPYYPKNEAYRYDSFAGNGVLLNKKKNHLPAMGWNSWNAFGSGNTEALTKEMAKALCALGLKDLGYEYVVLDDGCYKPSRVQGEVSNEETKFPSGFRALSDYLHDMGLKFGMYNDVGTNLCAGAEVGTCGFEDVDASCYTKWGVDFIKVDNCYYPWDNATFSNPTNAKYVFAPRIKSITVSGGEFEKTYTALDFELYGSGVEIIDVTGESALAGEKESSCSRICFAGNIGTYDGTGPDTSPVGFLSGEVRICADVPENREYFVSVEYATGEEVGCGSWLQFAVGEGDDAQIVYDDFVPATADTFSFAKTKAMKVSLTKGPNLLRFMNHRRQENTLGSYAALLEGFNKANPEHDVIISICEWGKTHPHNWGYKVGDSWRILNDITFRVGSDGNPGFGAWKEDYTTSVTSQYNKAVIMDEFAGLDKGWNDPDMMMIGMNGLDNTMCKTHMAMWCMMNSPLMLGLDLRRVQRGDDIWTIIANRNLIALNQDSLGIQAKRIYCSLAQNKPDTTYVRDIERVDVLAKPLSDNSVALSFINVSNTTPTGEVSVDAGRILEFIGCKLPDKNAFADKKYRVVDLWTGEETINSDGVFKVSKLEPCENVTLRIYPM